MKEFEKLLNFSLINIDKPSGPTSFSVSEYVKRALGLKKTSHMGTLDPKVTGVLPITLGRACKLASYFISHDKGYVGVLHTHKNQDIEKLQKLVDSNFLGKIKQTPPHRSAVKREERERRVYNFKFLEGLDTFGDIWDSSKQILPEKEDLVREKDEEKKVEGELKKDTGKDFLFYCDVEGGTYIRKICSDLGEFIGGAHMRELRRVRAGIFDESKIYTLEEFDLAVLEYKKGNFETLKRMLVRAKDALMHVLKVVNVEKRAVKSLYHGKPLFKRDIVGEIPNLGERESFAVFSSDEFIGTYKRGSEKDIFGRAEFVYN